MQLQQGFGKAMLGIEGCWDREISAEFDLCTVVVLTVVSEDGELLRKRSASVWTGMV